MYQRSQNRFTHLNRRLIAPFIGLFLFLNKGWKTLVLISGGLPFWTWRLENASKGKSQTSSFRRWLKKVCAFKSSLSNIKHMCLVTVYFRVSCEFFVIILFCFVLFCFVFFIIALLLIFSLQTSALKVAGETCLWINLQRQSSVGFIYMTTGSRFRWK